MTPRTSRRVLIGAMVVSLVLLLAAQAPENGIAVIVLSIAGLVAFAFGLVQAAVFWRCPTCRRMLPVRGNVDAEFCPHCGYSIDDAPGLPPAPEEDENSADTPQ